MCRYYKKSYAYSARSEHLAHGPVGQVSELISVGRFYLMGKKLVRTNIEYCVFDIF